MPSRRTYPQKGRWRGLNLSNICNPPMNNIPAERSIRTARYTAGYRMALGSWGRTILRWQRGISKNGRRRTRIVPSKMQSIKGERLMNPLPSSNRGTPVYSTAHNELRQRANNPAAHQNIRKERFFMRVSPKIRSVFCISAGTTVLWPTGRQR